MAIAQTEIVNLSPTEQYFDFVLPHGVTLQPGESMVRDGDLATALAAGAGRYSRQRSLAAMRQAIADGVCAVLPYSGSSVPSP